jgi:acetate kinase
VPTTDLILTLNAGSSSLRFALFEIGGSGGLARRCDGKVERLGSGERPICRMSGGEAASAPSMASVTDHASAIAAVLDWLAANGSDGRFAAAGHRIVHGGAERAAPAVVDAALLQELDDLVPLAPLHQPHGLAAIRALQTMLPDCLQVACFDSAFHQTMPARAQRLSLPETLAGKRLRRIGFHGLSYEYLAQQLSAQAPEARRAVLAHLGNGVSMCALRDGRSVDTTMGLTPLDGVPMGTRSGSVDPGLLLWLLQHGGYDAPQLSDLLYLRSGLLGMSGLSADMRVLLDSSAPDARQAVEVFAYQCAKALAALTVPLQGLDCVVFTGGIGENAPAVRAAIIDQCEWLGLSLDVEANQRNAPCISSPASRVPIRVIATDEETVLARHAADLLFSRQA